MTRAVGSGATGKFASAGVALDALDGLAQRRQLPEIFLRATHFGEQ
jgi:hypothetical protein